MKRTQTSSAFTLVELLTVVAIIALLIGILVPAVTRARTSAMVVAVKAQHHGLTQGLEMYRGDFGYYPSSVPQTNVGLNADEDRGNVDATYVVQGVHRLAFGLMGRDKLGCPLKSGKDAAATSDLGPDSIAGYYYSETKAFDGVPIDADGANWGNDDNITLRRRPYINLDGLTIIEDNSLDNPVDADGHAYCWVICDKFDKRPGESVTLATQYVNHSPILYYSHNERGKRIFETGSDEEYRNLYFQEDNAEIEQDFVDADQFWTYIEDQEAKVGAGAGATRRPHNPDSFLLISAGPDREFDTDDDIVNWEK